MTGSSDLETGPLNLGNCNKAGVPNGVINRSKMQIGALGSWFWSPSGDGRRAPQNCLPPHQTSVGRHVTYRSGRRTAPGLTSRCCHRRQLVVADMHGESRSRPSYFRRIAPATSNPRVVIAVSGDTGVAKAENPPREAADVGCNDQRQRAG